MAMTLNDCKSTDYSETTKNLKEIAVDASGVNDDG